VPCSPPPWPSAWGLGSAQGAILTYEFDLGGGLTGWGSFNDSPLFDAGGGYWSSPITAFSFLYDGFTYNETHSVDPGDGSYAIPLAWLTGAPTPSFIGFQYYANQNGNQVEFVSGSDPAGSDWGSVEITGNTPFVSTPLDNINTQPTGGGGPAAVPEPETWLASLLALGLVFAARRRRSQGAEPALLAA
jgi:hypothetical protein